MLRVDRGSCGVLLAPSGEQLRMKHLQGAGTEGSLAADLRMVSSAAEQRVRRLHLDIRGRFSCAGACARVVVHVHAATRAAAATATAASTAAATATAAIAAAVAAHRGGIVRRGEPNPQP